jgi:hypothetical protein
VKLKEPYMRKGLVPVVALILLAAVSAFAVEVPVSDITYEASPSSKRLPALTSGDGGYLAVWLDGRNGDFTLMATRVAATGEPLDPIGIPLGRAAYRQPQVLWSGQSYLVFWNASEDSARLMVTQVSREGVAGAPSLLREHARLDMRARAVATNGTYVVLAYTEGYGDRSMHVAVMTPDAVLIEDRIVDARSSLMPTVVANGRDFLVAWSVSRPGEPYAIVALRLDFRGAAIDASPRKIGEGYGAEIVRNGNDYVAISPTSGEGEPEYQSWHVSRDLAQIGVAAPLPLNHYERVPSLLDGAPARMVIFDVTDGYPFVSAVTFGGNGHEAGPRKRMAESVASHFAAARGDDALALIEVEPYGVTTETLAGSVFDEATLSRTTPDRLLALSATAQREPAIAGGGSLYLAVWRGPEGLEAGRFLPDGTRLDGNGFALDPYGRSAAVVFDGERFVVSYVRWKNNRYDTVVRFVSPRDGLLPDSEVIDSSPYLPSRPSLAAGDGVVLLAWTRSGVVHAAALRGTQMIGVPRKIADSDGVAAAASWSGGRFLVVWDERDFDYDMYVSARLQSMRLESDLTPMDAQPRLLFARRGGSKEPVLAAWKGGWLVAFEDGSDVRLHEIAGNGEMAETPVATMAGRSPKLVNARSRPWLAWTAEGPNLLRAAPVRPDGTLDAKGAVSIAAPPFGSSFGYSSSIGALGDGVALAYARVALEAGTVERVFLSVPESRSPGRRRSMR